MPKNTEAIEAKTDNLKVTESGAKNGFTDGCLYLGGKILVDKGELAVLHELGEVEKAWLQSNIEAGFLC